MRVGHLLSQLLAVPAGAQDAPASGAPLFADQPLSLLPDELWHPSAAALAPPAVTPSAADPSTVATAAGDAPAAAQAGKLAAGSQGLGQPPLEAAEGGKNRTAGWDSDQQSDSDDDSLQVFNLTEEPEDCESGSPHVTRASSLGCGGLPGDACCFCSWHLIVDVLVLMPARLPVLV